MNALPTDIENALQHTIRLANDAFTTGMPLMEVGPSAARGKKRKKGASEDVVEKNQKSKERKQKKKKHNNLEGNTSDKPSIDPVLLEVPMVEKKKHKRRKYANTPPPQDLTSTAELDTLAVTNNLSSSNSWDSSSRSSISDACNPSVTTPAPYSLASLGPGPAGDDSLPPLNTNEDILRAFQDLDLTRLAGVLSGLDASASDTQLNDFLQGETNKLYADQDPLANAPVFANPAVTAPSSQSRNVSAPARPLAAAKPPPNPPKPTITERKNTVVVTSSTTKPEHLEMLATKWLSTSKLKSLVETQGLFYKKGKFSVPEEQTLKAAIEDYRVGRGLQPEEITGIIFSRSKEANNTFWSEITASAPGRPIIAVYHHLRRAYHPLRLQGKWSADEDLDLIRAVTDLGQAWSKVSDRVGRSAQDCRDRWRNHLAHRSDKQTGPWSAEEEEKLTRIVTELTTAQGKDSDNDVFWGIVSERMGHKRSRQQCRIKWTDTLNKTVKNAGQTPRWGKLDAFILVHKVASLDIRDDSEIDWKLLPDPDWNLWSAHTLQRRWKSMKSGIKGHEEMGISEIIEILKQKNPRPAHIEEQTTRKTVRKKLAKPISSEVIEDEGEADQTHGCGNDEEDSDSQEGSESTHAD